MTYQIEWYENSYFEEWDTFIYERAVNGTFLQTRKFLSYHPKDRFRDCSVIVKRKGMIVAVCPACESFENGTKVFMSHGGSTYGGLIISSSIYKIEKMIQLIRDMENFLKSAGFFKIIYKQTTDLLSQTKNDLLNFCMQYEGYKEEQELNLYIDLERYAEPIIDHLDQGRRRWIKKCLVRGMRLKELRTEGEYKRFHEILSLNLKKYGLSPVHTVDELMLLKNLLKEEVRLFGVEFDGMMAAGTMVFCFEKVRCLHTHYLAADPGLEKYSPMSFVYYSMIDHAIRHGYKRISWGIATDHEGNVNWNLCRTKESYGSQHEINRRFVKRLEG